MAITDCSVSDATLMRLSAHGVDFVQLRDHDANAGDLFRSAERILRAVSSTGTKVLINTRADIALAAGAHGVHLRSHEQTLTPAQVRALFERHGLPRPTVSISCHTLPDIARAKAQGADLALFGPVFEKRVHGDHIADGIGLASLTEACALATPMPVLALGGVTTLNARACTDAGAAGIAGITLFR